MRPGWEDAPDPEAPIALRSSRGRVPFVAAMRSALASTPLRIHRDNLESATRSGSGGFGLVIPFARYPGRGQFSLALDLVYNSRVWQRIDRKPSEASSMR